MQVYHQACYAANLAKPWLLTKTSSTVAHLDDIFLSHILSLSALVHHLYRVDSQIYLPKDIPHCISMSLKIISHGVDVQSVTGPEVGDNPSVQDIGSNTKTVDVGSLGPRGGMPELTIKFSRDGGEGHVMVPINALPADRRRGWTELTSGVPGVLAYHILDPAGDSVLFLNLPSTADWMGKIPDNVSLADLTLPGTHESSAIHGSE